MNIYRFIKTFGMLIFGAAACLSQSAIAQEAYPSHPIKLIVPLAPGGSSDIYARLLGKYLGEVLKQPLVIENKPGASGAIAASQAARAPADGYTLFFANSTILALLPSMMDKPPFDAEQDFAQISLIGIIPLLIAVHPSLPAASLTQLVQFLKLQPGKYSYGTAGIGTPPHLAGELFQKVTGTKLLHVPYQGSAPADNDAIAGVNLVHTAGFATALPLHKAGKLRMISVMDTRRANVAPDLPTSAESGYPDLLASSFFVLTAPAGTPRATLSMIYEATQRVMDNPEFRNSAAELSVESVSGFTAEKTQEFVRKERYEKWLPIIRATGAKSN